MSKVSVVITAYNIEDYIKRCIESTINQSFKDIEIIVTNDGSTDHTLDIITDYARQDSRIKIVTQENKGIADAREAGYHAATGKYLIFIDGDDWLELDALQKLYDRAEETSADVVLFHVYKTFDDHRSILKSFTEDDEILKQPLKGFLLGGATPSIWCKLFRREFMVLNNVESPRGISFGEDFALVVSIFVHAPKVAKLDAVLYNYYQRESSITHQKKSTVLQLIKAINFIQNLLIKEGIYETYREEFERIAYYHLFIHRVLWSTEHTNIEYQLYRQFKDKKINIKANKYIRLDLKETPPKERLRINLYNTNYFFGKALDDIRELFKHKKIG